jgi:hypothetical protein
MKLSLAEISVSHQLVVRGHLGERVVHFETMELGVLGVGRAHVVAVLLVLV